MRSAIVAILSPAQTLGGWFFGLLLLTFGFAHRPGWESGGIFRLWWRPWFAKRWRYSNAYGRTVVSHPTHGDGVYQHELVHVRQGEDLGLFSVFAGLLVVWIDWRATLIVIASSPLWLLLGYVTSWIRGNRVYKDAEHERAAYAQTLYWRSGATTWLDYWTEKNARNT